MLVASLALSVAILFATRRNKGPEWAMALMWAICVGPIAIGMIDFRFVNIGRWLLDIVICGSMLCMLGGALFYRTYVGGYVAIPVDPVQEADDFERMRRVCRWLWIIGMLGGFCLIADFVMAGNRSLSNINELRDTFVTKESASFFARIGSLLTWAGPFCFLFALLFRDRLKPGELVFFLLPIGAFLLGALLSAGRQAAFQVLLFSLIGQALYRIRKGPAADGSGRVFIYATAAAMVSYMGFIAIVRNDNRISDVKSEVLARLFDFTTAGWFDAAVAPLGTGIRETIIEAVVYFSSSVALFDRFLDTDLKGISFGAMNLPFLYRQLTPLTGIDVIQMYELKVATLNAQNVIGVGWTTTLSHLIMDFGYGGSAILLFLQGMLGAWAWRKALRQGDFISCVFATLMTIAAIYMPLLPAFSDTNLFLMLIFCIVWRFVGTSGAAPAPATTDPAA